MMILLRSSTTEPPFQLYPELQHSDSLALDVATPALIKSELLSSVAEFPIEKGAVGLEH